MNEKQLTRERQMLALLKAGASHESVAEQFGIKVKSVERYISKFRSRGHMGGLRRRQSTPMTEGEKATILEMLDAKKSYPQIAAALGRHRSTVVKKISLMRACGEIMDDEGEEIRADNDGFLAALRENERPPAEQNVRSSSVVRVVHAPSPISSVGSPADLCVSN